MSLGAIMYSTGDISWEEFSAFVLSLENELPDITIAAAPHHPEAAFYKGKEWATFVLHDQSTDWEHLLEEMSCIRGIPQKTVIIIDMNSLDLVTTFARAFARRYPCVFQFGDHYQDNQDIFNEGVENTNDIDGD